MLEAVRLQGFCLQFASKELQGNPKVQGVGSRCWRAFSLITSHTKDQGVGEAIRNCARICWYLLVTDMAPQKGFGGSFPFPLSS